MSSIKNVIRGDTHTISLAITGAMGAIVDLTGATVFFTVNAEKSPTDDSAAVIQKTVTIHSDPTAGKTVIKLDPADTDSVAPGNYWYDIQIRASNGDISSLPKARFEIVSDISRRSA